MSAYGVYVGRFCPIHKGHERTIKEILNQYGPEKTLIVVGSSNAPISLRNFFSYIERVRFIKTVFPEIEKVVGLPDYHSDEMWLSALDDILRFGGVSPEEVTFFGGCKEDIRFFLEDGRNCQIINRFTEKRLKLSATEVRDHLIHGRTEGLKKMVSPSVHDEILATFHSKWELFKKT